MKTLEKIIFWYLCGAILWLFVCGTFLKVTEFRIAGMEISHPRLFGPIVLGAIWPISMPVQIYQELHKSQAKQGG